MAVKFALITVGAYLVGSIPTAYLAAKWSRGIDIRNYGSGNVGFTNLFYFTSKRVSIPVLIFDLGKGVAMVSAALALGLGIPYQVVVGLATVVGHNWPVFLRFNGGKGLLTTLGLALALPSLNRLVPWEVMAFLVIAAILLVGFHNLPLGTGLGVATMPLVSWGLGRPLALTGGFLAMFLLVVIRRLAVPRSSLASSLPTSQLLVNRLLFDRDIRDREAWINRTPPDSEKD